MKEPKQLATNVGQTILLFLIFRTTEAFLFSQMFPDMTSFSSGLDKGIIAAIIAVLIWQNLD